MSIQANFPNLKPTLLLDFANTEALDPRITFTRASTATFYDGKTVAKAEENLLAYSEQFESWGGLNNATVTPNNTTAPDGTSTADRINLSAGTGIKYVGQGNNQSAGSVTTFSVYAKAGTHSIIQFLYGGANGDYVNFNLSTGALGSASGGVGAISSVGNGWYRCSFTQNPIGTDYTSVNVGAVDSTTALRAANTSSTGNFFLWGAQLEQRATATAYTATTTQPITNYIPVLQTAGNNVARFDHNPTTGESLGLLVEEQRTNLQPYSNDFANGVWIKDNGSTITSNAAIAPDGTLSADLLRSTVSGNNVWIYDDGVSTGFAANTRFTNSVYLKSNGVRFGYIRFEDKSNTSNYVYFDLLSGTISATGGSLNTTSTITSVGNGWYRCTVSGDSASGTGGNNMFLIGLSDASGSTYITANSVAGIFVWGAQLEQGSFATSYIATGASQVTRSADAPVITDANFSSWYRTDEGTVYAEYVNAVIDGGTRLLEIWQSPPFSIAAEISADGSSWSAKTYANGAYQSSVTLGSSPAAAKVAYAFKRNDFAGVLNAGSAATSAAGLLQGATRFDIGFTSRSGTDTQINGALKKIAYYPARLTNAQLQALTS